MQRAPQADYEACIAATASRSPVYGLKVEDLVWTELTTNATTGARDLIAPQLRGARNLMIYDLMIDDFSALRHSTLVRTERDSNSIFDIQC